MWTSSWKNISRKRRAVHQRGKAYQKALADDIAAHAKDVAEMGRDRPAAAPTVKAPLSLASLTRKVREKARATIHRHAGRE